MIRIIAAIFIGLLAGVVTVSIFEGLGHLIWPAPPGNLKDPEYLKSIMHTIPLQAKYAVLFSWGLGIFVGGVVARLISNRAPYAALIVALGMFAAAMVTMIAIPHPQWMVWNAIAISIIALLLANRVTRR